jgi:hypothetical protein
LILPLPSKTQVRYRVSIEVYKYLISYIEQLRQLKQKDLKKIINIYMFFKIYICRFLQAQFDWKSFKRFSILAHFFTIKILIPEKLHTSYRSRPLLNVTFMSKNYYSVSSCQKYAICIMKCKKLIKRKRHRVGSTQRFNFLK